MTNNIHPSSIAVTLDVGAKVPTKAHASDAGWDIYAKEDFAVPGSVCSKTSGEGVTIGSATHDTGVHIAIPEGYVGFLKSKSGLNVKHSITGEGVIDAGYTGSIVVKLYNHGSDLYLFRKGEKIIQLVILPICTQNLEVVSSLEETERGDNGFGSSGT